MFTLRKKRIGILLASAALAAAVCVWFLADVEPVITLNGSDRVEINYGETYEEEGAAGKLAEKLFGQDLFSIRPSVIQNDVRNEVGTYQIVYEAGFLFQKATAERTVVVVDREPPVIELAEQKDSELTLPGEPFQECGYRAMDNVDGDVADQVESREENGRVIYTVTDSSGNTATAERIIRYKDTEPPVITLIGSEHMTLKVGEAYNEPGYTAADQVDGDLTGQVVVEHQIDSQKPGVYEVVYTVEDHGGNQTAAKRTVTVASPLDNPSNNSGDKVIYLTFDDGPGPYTEKLLNILDEYNVKVTFFVTNGYPEYRDMIGEAYRRGHTIAIHTYSHSYSDVYASKEAYYDDLNKMQEIIVEQTGEATTLFRFPGGSSNTVSRKYCKGIMSLLTESLEEDGYHYFDWNVSSTDGGGTTETSVVVDNVINGCSGKRASVVLQHDIKSFSVDAVPQIIEWGLRNGYTFRALDENSPTAHHGVNN
ncbi:MAG: DUF5011 domain-containing protein [Oscillibacter sp.]|nr:DUF5011 domain-containing protein [Oscillibacter sp.]